MFARLSLTLVCAALLASCRVEFGQPALAKGGAGAQTVRIYSSMFKQVIEAVEPALLAQAPGVKIEWFQSGSEKIATRLDAELSTGGSPCDLLLTSDPAYYARLKREGRLVPYVSPRALRQPRDLVDPDGAWATARLSVMVLGVAPEALAPKGFRELARSGLRIAIGDPLSSGTSFTTVSTLSARYGWDYFRALKKAGAVIAGGNASVLQRLQTGESQAGWVLVENLLSARARGDKIQLVIPADGAVIVPGPVALLEHARHSEAARAVYDALLSEPVQRVLIEKGYLYSPDPALPPPGDLPPLQVLLSHATATSAEPPEQIKEKFNSVFFQ